MKIRLVTEEDKNEWNRVAYESSESTYAHTWEWKELIEQGLGLESICIVAEDQNRIVGIFPAFIQPKFNQYENCKIIHKLASKCRGIWSPLDITWDYGGPCAIPDTDKTVLINLINFMEEYAKKHYILDIRISPYFEDYLIEYLRTNNYRKLPRLTSIIDITESEEELWHRIKKNTRKYINKSQENGIQVYEQTDDIGLLNFYNCIKDLKNSNDFIYIPPYSFYELMLDKLKPKNMIKIHNVSFNNEVIGGSLSLVFKDNVTFRYAKVIKKYQDLYPHYLLHWMRIKESKYLGYKYIDLGGIPNDTTNGIYFFKTRWGGEIRSVDWYVKDILFGKFRSLRRKIKEELYFDRNTDKKIE